MKRRDHDGGGEDDAMEVEDGCGALDEYFEGYVRPSVHRTMLSDAPRMRSFLRAVQQLSLAGKTVLDVGCGTGLLACWCARHGAARVVAVEASPMARAAREVVEANGLSVVEVVECKVEDLQLPPGSVDVIVSEWMGFHLVNESMLDSVLFARDRFLAPGGIMIPGAVRLLAAPAQVDEEVNFWMDPSKTGGLDMSSLMRLAVAERCTIPSIEIVNPDCLLAAPQVAAQWNLHSITREDARRISAMLSFDTTKAGTLTSLVLWFDTDIGLDCSPFSPPTHWKQTVVSLETYVEVSVRQPITCELVLEQEPLSTRHYSCTIDFKGFDGHELDCDCFKCQLVRGE